MSMTPGLELGRVEDAPPRACRVATWGRGGGGGRRPRARRGHRARGGRRGSHGPARDGGRPRRCPGGGRARARRDARRGGARGLGTLGAGRLVREGCCGWTARGCWAASGSARGPGGSGGGSSSPARRSPGSCPARDVRAARARRRGERPEGRGRSAGGGSAWWGCRGRIGWECLQAGASLSPPAPSWGPGRARRPDLPGGQCWASVGDGLRPEPRPRWGGTSHGRPPDPGHGRRRRAPPRRADAPPGGGPPGRGRGPRGQAAYPGPPRRLEQQSHGTTSRVESTPCPAGAGAPPGASGPPLPGVTASAAAGRPRGAG